MTAPVSRLQLIGPLVLFGATLLAEMASFGLTQMPSSAFLWYVNLEFFRVFQKSYIILSDYAGFAFAQLWLVALPLAALAGAGVLLRQRLMIAISSNLSFVYACFLVYSWYRGGRSGAVAALGAIPIPSGPNSYLFVLLLSASLLSLCVSHLNYIRDVRHRT